MPIRPAASTSLRRVSIAVPPPLRVNRTAAGGYERRRALRHLLLRQPGADALAGGQDVVHAVGIGEAQIARAEAGAGDHGDPDFLQQRQLEFLGGYSGLADIGEGIERAARIDAGESRYG